MIITIDGPAASGKGVTARKIAQQLNFFYLNTGFLYRAVAYLLLHEYGYTEQQLHAVKEHDVHACVTQLQYTYSSTEQEKVSANGVDLTPYLKKKDIDVAASFIAAQLVVRTAVVALEHALAQKENIVVDGRDSGSTVFPQAEHKFFLTASLEVRVQRWQKDQQSKGKVFSFSDAQKILEERDARDSERAVAPLVTPEGATVIDNSLLTIEQTVQVILNKIEQQKREA